MTRTTQKVLIVWIIPEGSRDSPFDQDVHISISEDKIYWYGCTRTKGVEFSFEKEGTERIWSQRVEDKHPDTRWEVIRQYIFNILLPSLIKYDDLDRFTDLEE